MKKCPFLTLGGLIVAYGAGIALKIVGATFANKEEAETAFQKCDDCMLEKCAIFDKNTDSCSFRK